MCERLGAEDLTIVAMGKFGGREIAYGADLDVLFIGNDSRTAQKLLTAIAQPSAAGPLARVDARLRPEGEKGPLVIPLAAYQQYYATRAQLWELQALTRARPIFGPSAGAFEQLAQNAWQTGGRQPDLFNRVDDMLQRIRRERGAGSEFASFRTGTGGAIEAEFLVQALQMRENLWQPNWTEAVDALTAGKQFGSTEGSALKTGYHLLRRIESVLRRYENSAISSLPVDPIELERLGRRLGFKSLEDFNRAYESARKSIHDIYVRKFRAATVRDGEKSSPALAEQER
jgi:glutamate-ammonia-ligase adenylyltransferase